MSYRLCSLHFDEKMYMSPNKNSRLVWNAEPMPISGQNPEQTKSSSPEKVAKISSGKSNSEKDETNANLSVQGPQASTKISQRLPGKKSGKSFDWSLSLDDDIIVKEETMTDQDEAEGPASDSSSAIPKKNVKHEAKEAIRSQTETDEVAAEESNGKEVAEKDSSQHRISSTQDPKQKISAQDRPGISDCEDYSLFMSPAGDSATDSAEEDDMDREYTDSSDRKEIMKNASCSTDGLNVSCQSSVDSSTVSTASASQQRKITITKVKSFSSKKPVATRITNVLPQIKKELNASQSLNPTGENISSVTSAVTMPPITRIKKEPVNTAEMMSMDDEHGELCEGDGATSVEIPQSMTISIKGQFKQIGAVKSDVSLSQQDPPEEGSPSSSSPVSPRTGQDDQDGVNSLTCQVPSRVYSKTHMTRGKTASAAQGSSISAMAERGSVSPRRRNAPEIKCTPEIKLARNSEADNQPTVGTIIVNEKDLMEMEEQESCGCSKDCSCKECESKKGSLAERLSSSVRRTYSGPIRRQVVKTKDGGKRTFMILNKNSLKTLQARGLIQHVKTIGNGQSASKPVFACKSLLPAVQEDLKKVQQTGTPSRVILPSKSDEAEPNSSVSTGGEETPVVVSWAPAGATNTPSITFTIQLPGKDNEGTTPQKAASGSNLRQIVTPPVFIQSSSTNHNPSSSSPQLSVTGQVKQVPRTYKRKDISPTISQNSSGLTYTSVGASHPTVSFSQLSNTISSTSSSKPQSKWNTVQSLEDMEASCDSPPPGPSSPQGHTEEDPDQTKMETIELPEEVLKGPFTLRKGLKIFRCDRSAQNSQSSMKNVKWIAMPTVPVSTSASVRAPVPTSFRKTQPSGVHVNSINLPLPSQLSGSSGPYITNITKDVFRDSERSYERAKRALKDRYKRLLNKHRQRYYLLLKKYRSLEKRYSIVEDAGSREQVVRDAHKYLSEDHLLFMESQMFLRNRTGKGNRFSKKFIRLMIRLYESSAAGYRFMRTIFTIPSVKTVQKWQNRLFDIMDEDEKDPLDITLSANPTEAPSKKSTGIEGITVQQEPIATTSSDKEVDKAFQASTTLFRSIEAPGRPETDGSSSGSGSDDSDGGDEEDLDEDLEDEEEDFDEDIHTEHEGEKNIYQNNSARSATTNDEITIAWEEPWSVMN